MNYLLKKDSPYVILTWFNQFQLLHDPQVPVSNLSVRTSQTSFFLVLSVVKNTAIAFLVLHDISHFCSNEKHQVCFWRQKDVVLPWVERLLLLPETGLVLEISERVFGEASNLNVRLHFTNILLRFGCANRQSITTIKYLYVPVFTSCVQENDVLTRFFKYLLQVRTVRV